MESTPRLYLVPDDRFVVTKDMGPVFLSIPEGDIARLVEDYVRVIETEVTEVICKCEWETHPDDMDVLPGHCRYCKDLRDYHESGQLSVCKVDACDCTQFLGRRTRRKDDHPECPVHTKAGFILGFFRWVYRDVPTQF